MSGGKIVGFRPNSNDDVIETMTEEPQRDAWYTDDAQDEPSAGSRAIPILLGLLGAAWLGLVGWASAPALAAGTMGRVEILTTIAIATAPLALLGVVALLLFRTSRSETRRYLDAAARLRAESVALERRLSEMTVRIEANREALGTQVDHLLRLGDDAGTRIATLTTELRGEAGELERHADTLKSVTELATANMGVLLGDFPRIESELRRLADGFQATGLAALEQARSLEAELAALTVRGREADQVAGGAAERLAAHLQQMEGTSAQAGSRIEESAGRMTGAIDAALARAAEAFDEARRGMEAQGAAMLAMVEQSRAALDRTGTDSTDGLAARVGAIMVQVEALGAALAGHDETSRGLVERLGGGLGELEQRLALLGDDGSARTERLASAVRDLGTHAEHVSTVLAGAGSAADNFVQRAESLLTALDASAREIDETLPAAFARLDQYSAASRERIDAMQPGIGAIESGATSALDRLAQTERLLEQQRTAIEQLSQTVATYVSTGRSGTEELSQVIETANARITDLADGSSQQLVGVMLRVRDAAQQAAERARETLDRVVPEAAAALGNAGEEAVRQALSGRVESQIAALAEAAENAVQAASIAAERLGQQIAIVNESTRALEERVEAARDEADDANRDSFARRASLLVEALNSTAIDVAKILSNEVTDSAWSAYLKGDRGVFTRRAVRLLDAGESKEVLRYYESDGEFREQVNRYIHDFEAMLRNVLATREGSQIAVTLLSSDMGKLYVALAQAIERLRT
jgi:predicted transcriptional regulator